MEIDGYTPPDPRIALEEGTTFSYATPYGDINIIARFAGDENVPFAKALAKALQRHELQKKMGGVDAVQQIKDMLRCFADHVVIRWDTTIKSGGKAIVPTADAFVDLMASPAVRAVMMQFQQDVTDVAHFRAAVAEEAAKN